MDESRLVVLNFLLKPLAVLNDDSGDGARSIKKENLINGVGKLSFEIPLTSSKWHYVSVDNLVLYEGQLYVIQTPSLSQSDGSELISVDCHHLSVSLEGKLNPAFERTDAIGKKVSEMAELVLDGTGWTFGGTDIPDDKKRSLIAKEQSAMANIKKMAELFDCDYYFDATLDHKKVFFKEKSIDNLLTVTEGVNLKSLNVSIDKSQLITRIYVFGGNDEVTNRPITVFGAKVVDEDGEPVLDSNGVQKIHDKVYIEDYSYYIEQGYEMSYISNHPEFFLKESVLNMSDYLDKDDLYADSIKILKQSCMPKVEVTFDMADKIDSESYFIHTPELREIIYVYSSKINDKLKFKNRNGYNGNLIQLKVDSIKTDSEKPESIQITARNYSDYGGIVQDLIKNMDTINRVIQEDGTINTTKLQGWIDVLATQINSTRSFWYTDVDGNMIFENESKTAAMKLGGGIFALADSKNPDGTYRWRAFGTGNGFTATELVAGWLIGGKVKFDLEGGRLLIGDNWNEDYYLKFEPATGMKMKYNSTFMSFDEYGFTIRGNDSETLISQYGIANLNTDTVTDNIENGYPLRIPVRIDDSTSIVHEVIVNYTVYPFRTYSKGAEQKSFSKQTTSTEAINVNTTNSTTIALTTTNSESFTAVSTSVAQSTVGTSSSEKITLTSTETDGGTSITTPAGGGKTSDSSSSSTTGYIWNGDSIAVATTGITAVTGLAHQHQVYRSNLSHRHNMSHTHTVPNHTHTFNMPNHKHSITMPSHSHTVTIPEHSHSFTVPTHSHSITMPAHHHSLTIPTHSHSVDIPAHGHDLIFGILETPVVNNTMEIFVNGVKATTLTAQQGQVNITTYIQTPGWHYIEIRSNTLKKVSASVSVKSYMTR